MPDHEAGEGHKLSSITPVIQSVVLTQWNPVRVSPRENTEALTSLSHAWQGLSFDLAISKLYPPYQPIGNAFL